MCFSLIAASSPPLPPPSKQASSTYVSCAGLEYSDFMSLVHADMEIFKQASACFKEKADEIQV